MVDVRKIADRILRPQLAKLGLDRIVVEGGFDHNGEEALFIDAEMKPDAPIVGGEVSLRVYGALREALADAGEKRFPYFNIRHPQKRSPAPYRSKSPRRAS